MKPQVEVKSMKPPPITLLAAAAAKAAYSINLMHFVKLHQRVFGEVCNVVVVVE